MRSYQNPFRSKASEQQRDLRTFLRIYGPGALNLLPETLWDRLVILRSAPGAGKTSLMRLFTAESLILTKEHQDDFKELAKPLHELEALDEQGPKLLGVHLNLGRDYRALMDFGISEQASCRLFFRLLDARIMAAVLKAALSLMHRSFPENIADFALYLRHRTPGTDQAVNRLGGLDGPSLLKRCNATEQDILEKLDSLLPVQWDEHEFGHAEFYSLRLLSEAEILISGQVLRVKPLVMLDDGHDLEPIQRQALLKQLTNRELAVARWYSERYEALSHQEIMTEIGKEGRDYELVDLEYKARVDKKGQFEKLLIDIANRRAYRPLSRYTDRQEEFANLLEFENNELLGDRADEVIKKLCERVKEKAQPKARYQVWLENACNSHGYEAALRWQELEILIVRDRERRQEELFEQILDDEEARQRSSSAVREAAGLALAREFRLPYYAGPAKMAKLGSHNIEQFLSLCGDIFAEILAEITLHRCRPKISPVRQDRIVRQASRKFWHEIPRRVPYGRDIQRFVEAVVRMARKENEKPTAPYPPGVTGTALLMSDRMYLLDEDKRRAIPGAERLFHALSEAIAHNIISVELDQRVKNRDYMVIYLNRLLCPLFDLPLGRGGYREKRLKVMAQWLLDTSESRIQGAEFTEELPL